MKSIRLSYVYPLKEPYSDQPKRPKKKCPKALTSQPATSHRERPLPLHLHLHLHQSETTAIHSAGTNPPLPIPLTRQDQSNSKNKRLKIFVPLQPKDSPNNKRAPSPPGPSAHSVPSRLISPPNAIVAILCPHKLTPKTSVRELKSSKLLPFPVPFFPSDTRLAPEK